jgi:hypothetical protein
MAIYIVSVTFIEVILAYADYQLFFFRNVMYLGLLAGILMKLPSLDVSSPDAERVTTAGEHLGRQPQPAEPVMGRGDA